jgi:translation initiation factor IF-3
VRAQDYRRNRQIRVPEVRLINEKGEQVGVVETREAQRMADDVDLDLVEVSPTARPPVCKILDFGKFKYDTRKREQKSGQKKTSSQLKELRVRPAIDKHDLGYRLEQGRKFLKLGHKVQVVCIFRGRQMRHPEHGYSVMTQVIEILGDVAKIEAPAKMMGRRMTMLLSPLPIKPGVKGQTPAGGGAAKPAATPSAPAAPRRVMTPVDPPAPAPRRVMTPVDPPASAPKPEGGDV